MGGMVRALEAGYLQAEIADAACTSSSASSRPRGEIGVTRFADPDERRSPSRSARSRSDAISTGSRACAPSGTRSRHRDATAGDDARRGDVNLMPAIVEAVGAYATIEMCGLLRGVYGEYRGAAGGLRTTASGRWGPVRPHPSRGGR